MNAVKDLAWMKVLMNHDKKNISKLARHIDVTYSHVYELVKELEEKGIFKVTVNGREKNIELTKKGKKLKKSVNEIYQLLGL